MLDPVRLFNIGVRYAVRLFFIDLMSFIIPSSCALWIACVGPAFPNGFGSGSLKRISGCGRVEGFPPVVAGKAVCYDDVVPLAT